MWGNEKSNSTVNGRWRSATAQAVLHIVQDLCRPVGRGIEKGQFRLLKCQKLRY